MLAFLAFGLFVVNVVLLIALIGSSGKIRELEAEAKEWRSMWHEENQIVVALKRDLADREEEIEELDEENESLSEEYADLDARMTVIHGLASGLYSPCCCDDQCCDDACPEPTTPGTDPS